LFKGKDRTKYVLKERTKYVLKERTKYVLKERTDQFGDSEHSHDWDRTAGSARHSDQRMIG
jgi:hypothetical protein